MIDDLVSLFRVMRILFDTETRSFAFQPEYLVIGGGGFLGRHLCEQLLQRGYSVRAFDIRKTFDNDKISFLVGDLCNEKVCAFWLMTLKCVLLLLGVSLFVGGENVEECSGNINAIVQKGSF